MPYNVQINISPFPHQPDLSDSPIDVTEKTEGENAGVWGLQVQWVGLYSTTTLEKVPKMAKNPFVNWRIRWIKSRLPTKDTCCSATFFILSIFSRQDSGVDKPVFQVKKSLGPRNIPPYRITVLVIVNVDGCAMYPCPFQHKTCKSEKKPRIVYLDELDRSATSTWVRSNSSCLARCPT